MQLFSTLSRFYDAELFQQWNEPAWPLNIQWINTKNNEIILTSYDYNEEILLEIPTWQNLYILYEYISNDTIIFMPIVKNHALAYPVIEQDYYPPWVIQVPKSFDLHTIKKDVIVTLKIRWWFFITDGIFDLNRRYKLYHQNEPSLPYNDKTMLNLLNFYIKLREYFTQLKGAKDIIDLLAKELGKC